MGPIQHGRHSDGDDFEASLLKVAPMEIKRISVVLYCDAPCAAGFARIRDIVRASPEIWRVRLPTRATVILSSDPHDLN
jgi:hypothetical protein